MTLDAAAFKLGIMGWGAKVSEDADAGTRAIVARMFHQIVNYTPVGDPTYWKSPPPPGYVGGYARANWIFSLNAPMNPVPVGSPGHPLGNTPDFSEQIAAGKGGDIFYLQNAVPYILDLEQGTGSPRQAPQGMVARTFAEAEVFYEGLK